MLLVGDRRALYVPLLFFLAGGVIGAVSLAALAGGKADARVGALVGVLLGVVSLYFAAASVRRLTATADGKLRLRGLHKKRSLEVDSCAFGLRLKTGRVPSYIVFVTDGVVTEEIGEWGGEPGARRAIERLERSLLPPALNFEDDPRRRNQLSRAKRHVARVEREWQSQVAATQKVIDEYYQSKTWRRLKILLPALVVLYVVGMSLYFQLTGK